MAGASVREACVACVRYRVLRVPGGCLVLRDEEALSLHATRAQAEAEAIARMRADREQGAEAEAVL